MFKRIVSASFIAFIVASFLGTVAVVRKPAHIQRKTIVDFDGYSTAQKRNEWFFRRMVDPGTGKIHAGMRMLEVAYGNTLPSLDGNASGKMFDWYPRGPYKVGGRTRALAIDVTNENVIIAGGVSGGLWRTVNGGNSWSRVITPDQHPGITCVVQDKRTGKQNIWYAGTGGEPWGNSASEGYYINAQAVYLGNGVYKSVDNGLTWQLLQTTASNTPQTINPLDQIWNMAISSRTDSDVVYIATTGIIYRSHDGGDSCKEVLGKTGTKSMLCDIAITSTDVLYVTMSTYTTGYNETGASYAGIWRSTDGLAWTQIKPSGWPAAVKFRRFVIGINPSNENEVYFLGDTPESGQMSAVFFGDTVWHSLWKYTYLSGDGSGSGGLWDDLSVNIPNNSVPFDNFNTQGSYDMVVAVKPDEPNVVFIGGTNLYRSTDAFTSSLNITQIGGYQIGSELPFYELYPGQHPDQHKLVFMPSNPDIAIATTDGGIYKTYNCMATPVTWDSLNNGYISSQFYTIAIDHGSNNSKVITGGLQDNGSRWNNGEWFTAPWTFPSEGDGSYCAIEDGGGIYYFSRQEGKVIKAQLDANGNRIAFKRIDPIGAKDYLFIAPMLLDLTDNNTMYLTAGYSLWRNNNLSSLSPLDNTWDSISTGWKKIASWPDTFQNFITALSCSYNPPHILYLSSNHDGSGGTKILRIDSANSTTPVITAKNISGVSGIGKYVNCVAVDPRDADKIIVVFSNYSKYSLIYSENAGATWQKVAGNLEAPQPSGPPPGLGIGTGPSLRWASIIPCTNNRTIYLVGTSIGLFASDTLIDELNSTDSTLWMRAGASTIGNSVIEMIDFRLSDGYVAVATHGNGIFSSYITDAEDITKARWNFVKRQDAELKLYPNPAQTFVNAVFSLSEAGKIRITLTDIRGRDILTTADQYFPEGNHLLKLNIASLPQGIYYCSLKTNGQKVSRQFVKVN